MKPMTSRERFSRMYEHKEADRVPIIVSPWDDTIERWQREGMPPKTNVHDFFDLDHVATICVDNSPRYEERVIEETDEYITTTSAWGVTFRNWKHATSTPEFMDFTIKDRESWESAKARMMPNRDRINWANLKHKYASWREKGY